MMQGAMSIRRILLISFFLVHASAFAMDEETKSYLPCITITGDESKVTDRSFHRIQSLDEWAKLWVKHTGQYDVKYKNWNNQYDEFYNPLKLPLVDFDNFMVIAVFQGSSGNDAGVKAVSISENKNEITLRFKDKPYSTSGPGGGGKDVNCYGFFVVPTSNKTLVLEERKLIAKQPQTKNLLKVSKSDMFVEGWQKCHRFDAIGK